MKEMKRILCGIMASLMLVDAAAGISCTAYAEEGGAEEQEAILQMEPVEQEGMPLLQETEKQETGAPEQAAARTADTSAPQLDISSLHIEYDAKLGGEATLTYRVTDESEIVDVSCHIMVCANGLRTSNYIEHHGGRANKDGIVTETFRLNFYGKYEIVSISMRDVRGNATAYYNSAYSGYEGQLPAADLSIATISLPAPTEDNDPPVIDIDSIRLEKAVIANGEDNAMQLSVADATGVAELHAQFLNTENGKNADAMTITALGEGIFSLQLHRPSPGKWQLFFIDAIDVCGNTIRLIDAKHPYYSETFGTENLRDLSAIVFEVESESFATPVIDLTSISIDKNTSRNKEEVKISANVENPHSVRQFDVVYRVPTGGGDGAIVSDSVGMSYYTSGQFKGLLYPTYFGKYEVEWIELLDYNGEWQTIYNSAFTHGWTLPEDALVYDLSALSFDSVDAQIYTMEDLKAALATAKDGDKLQIAASENFVITEDITIPKGVYLNIRSGSGSFKVAKGVTLTTKSRFNCYVPMTVEGTWLEGVDTTESSAQSSVRELTVATGGAVESKDLSVDGVLVVCENAMLSTRDLYIFQKITVNGTWENRGTPYCNGGLTIGESGVVENNGYIRIADQYENHGKLINGSNGSARLLLWAKNETELLAALACDDPGEKEINFYIFGEMMITEDVRIPTNTELNIYDDTGEGKATLTIGEGTALTNFGSFNCYVPMIVAGTLTNVDGMRMEKGLTITATGTVDTTSGWLSLNGPLVNNGTLVKGSNMNQTLVVHSVDELQSALATMVPRGEVELKSEKELVLSSDMVIPKGITVEVYESVQSLRIAAGSKLVIDAEATLRSYAPLIVEGTVDNYGAIGARKGLSVTGKIENYNYIRTEGDLVGAENIRDHEAGNQSVRQQYAVDSEESLTNMLNTIHVSNRDWIRLMAAEGFALTKNITIPAGVYLEIQTGEFKVNSGATLTTYDNLIVNDDMRVDGCWENLWNRTGHSEVSGALTVNGVVKNGGRIDLYQYTEALAQGKIQRDDGGTLNIVVQVSSVEELQGIASMTGDLSMTVTWCGGDDLKLDQDLTIQRGIGFYARNAKITVPEGVTLVIEPNARVSAGDVDVRGTLLNDGDFDSNALTTSGKLVNHSFLQSDSITVSGELVNTSHLTCRNDITVSGQLTNSSSVSFSTLRIENGGYVGNAGVLMGKIGNRGRLERTERTEENMIFNVSLENSCDWKDVFANIRSGDTINGDSGSADAYIEVTEDTTLPENVSINGMKFRVKEGVTFTTSGSGFKPYTLQVDGTWVNNGSVELDRLVVNGNVQNNGSITTWEALTGTGTVAGNAAISAVRAKFCSAYELQEALGDAMPGDTVSCYVNYGNGGSLILNESITVPAGVTLKFDGETEKVYLAVGHTLTIDGTLILQQPLYAADDLVINGEVVLPSADEVDLGHVQYLELVSGGIRVIEGGSCELNGSIRVGKTDYTGQTIEDPRSLITGVAMEDWSLRDVGDHWHLTKKPAADKTEVFCSLPVVGCKLRLVGESGNVHELMSSGGYALVGDITPGEYTLEVSKPGYVTHTYKVDTTALPDVFDVELVQKGDVNGAATAGGAVDVTDMACLYTLLSTGHYSGQITDEEYQNAVADVNGDGRIDILDYQRLYTAVQGTAPLT